MKLSTTGPQKVDETISQQRRVSHLKAKPWNDKNLDLPADILAVPGMLWKEEKRMLYYLALEYYIQKGIIADMGCFLGGSTICFAAALLKRRIQGPLIHSYDLFKAELSENSAQHRYFPNGPPPGGRTREIFDNHLRNYQHLLVVHEGDVLTFPTPNQPIELLFVDIAKSYKVMDHLVMNFLPSLIPSTSLIIMQDYLSPRTGPWHHIVMEKLADYCEYIFDLGAASTVFLLKRSIPRPYLETCRWTQIPRNEKLELMQSAIDKLDSEKKKDFLRENLQILLQGKDLSWGMHYHKDQA